MKKMVDLKQREIPLLITAFSIGLMITEYFLNIDPLKIVANEFKTWAVITAAFALILGGISIFRLHIGHIRRRTEGKWYLSIFILALIVVMLIVGTYFGLNSTQYLWWYNTFYMPGRRTVFSLTALYILVYGYTAYKIKSTESAVLIITVMLCMLGNIPLGELIWSGFGDIASWLGSTGQMGGSRGMAISIAIGVIVISIRTLLGIEKGALVQPEGEG